jgi:glycosyltransferase involved in cell wall biosynthesis
MLKAKTITRRVLSDRTTLRADATPSSTYISGLPICPRRAPRVLHAITPSKLAGAETFLARLMRRASLDDFVGHIVTSRSRANRELLTANLPFDRVRIGGKANLLAVARLAAAARRFQADVLHSHLSTASWWCGWLEQFGGPPSIGHVHGFTSARWHRRQSHLIACSEAVKQDLIQKGIAREKITVLHYPLDPADLQPRRSAAEVRRELGASPDAPVVGTFAHLSPKKGHRELVQAAALVLSSIPEAQFWCFGDGALRAEIEKTARSLGIADRFKVLGFRRDVADLMHAVDVMCLPSHREPFGLVYVEAALAQKPVIACDAGGAPEVIVHQETGLLISRGAATASAAEGGANASAEMSSASRILPLADAIFTLLDNRSLASAMGRRGRELALERYQWPSFIAKLRELYERVMAG